jgi:acyl-CoA thioester hydrolase
MMLEYWRGGVEAWDCDEMGHMNVRFWVRRALDGLVMLARDLGLRHPVRLVPCDQHIRFVREAHAGAPLFLRGGVLAVEGDGIVVYSEIVHQTGGTIGATFITRVTLEDGAGAAVALDEATRAACLARLVQLPAHGAPRSIEMDAPLPDATLAWAERAGFTRVALGSVRADQVDELGRMYPEGFIGRVSEGVPTLLSGWRERVAAEASEADGVPRRAGAAVLEYRLTYRAWPRVGDLVEVRSGVVRVEDKTHVLQHWMVDPLTGAPWCVSEALAVTFDLNARKVIATPPRARAELERLVVDLDRTVAA